jgi:hypothetical protein
MTVPELPDDYAITVTEWAFLVTPKMYPITEYSENRGLFSVIDDDSRSHHSTMRIEKGSPVAKCRAKIEDDLTLALLQ